jgi:hypothetical protein
LSYYYSLQLFSHYAVHKQVPDGSCLGWFFFLLFFSVKFLYWYSVRNGFSPDFFLSTVLWYSATTVFWKQFYTRRSRFLECRKKQDLKGPWREIFDLWFFVHQITPHGALTHGLTSFRKWGQIREDIRQSVLDSGVNNTPEYLQNSHKNMNVSVTPLCPNYSRRFHSQIYSRIRSHIQKGVNSWIRGPGEVACWKKNQRSKIMEPLNGLACLFNNAKVW